MMNFTKLRLGIALGVLVPLVIWAGDLVVPHTFTAGGPIRADEMNANFEAVRAAVNTKADRVDAGTAARLKVVQFRSTDGTTLPSSGVPPFAYYDSQLSVYCSPELVGAKVRCLPRDVLSGPFAAMSGAVELGNTYLDSSCTQPVAWVRDRSTPVNLAAVDPKFIIMRGSSADGGMVFNRVGGSVGLASTLYESRNPFSDCIEDVDCLPGLGLHCNTTTSRCENPALDGGTVCLVAPAAPAGGWRYVVAGAPEPEASFAELSLTF